MKVPGFMSGNNELLNSVMSQQSTSGSYAERSLQGRKAATSLHQQEMGKASVGELQTNAKEDAENIDEAISKAAAKKQEADRVEAQRIAQKQTNSQTSPNTSSQGDTVTISPEGQVAAKNVSVAVTPAPAQPSLQVTPAQTAPAQAVTVAAPSAPTQAAQAPAPPAQVAAS